MSDYKDEKIWLMHGDCIEKMKQIPDGSIDMILTDPPYELSKSKGGGMMGRENREFMNEVNAMDMVGGFNFNLFIDESKRLFKSKDHLCCVFMCSTKQIYQYIQFAENNGYQYGVGVWHKTNPAPLCNCKYLNDIEYWIYIKGKKSKILGNYASKSMVFTSPVNKKDKKEFNHPTCKPVELMEKFIINHSCDDFVILDPFMGSAASGVSAKKLNRKFIGIEMDGKYFEIAKNRILKS